MIVTLTFTECGFNADEVVKIYATSGPGIAAVGAQTPPYGVGRYVGYIMAPQAGTCTTKRFRVTWARPGTYRFVMVQRWRNHGWTISRTQIKI